MIGNSKNKMKKILILIAIVCCLTLKAEAAFENLDICARSTVLCNTFVSIADDVSALYVNPAGTTYLTGKMAGFSYAKLNLGVGNLNSGFVGVALPMKDFSIGIYANIFGEESLYRENTYGISLGYKTNVSEYNSVSIGVTAKSMVKEIGVTQEVIDNPLLGDKKSTSGYSADAGLIFRMLGFGSIGVSVLNINQPNIGFLDDDKLPMTIKAGLSLDVMKGMVAGAGFNYVNGDYIVDAAAEYKETSLGFAARLSGEFGSGDYKKINAGITYDYNLKRTGLCISFDWKFIRYYGFLIKTGHLKYCKNKYYQGICLN